MTEAAYQEARKIMQSANYRRGMITKAKGEVSKWTKIEDSYRKDLREGQANGAAKKLATAMKRLDESRQHFADLKFPDNNLSAPKVEKIQCEGCGASIAKGNTYCGECICED